MFFNKSNLLFYAGSMHILSINIVKRSKCLKNILKVSFALQLSLIKVQIIFQLSTGFIFRRVDFCILCVSVLQKNGDSLLLKNSSTLVQSMCEHTVSAIKSVLMCSFYDKRICKYW